MLVRCSTCYGNKRVSGMGGMTQKCANCSGDGSVTVAQAIEQTKPVVAQQVKNESAYAVENEAIKKKRGRPSKEG